MLAVDIVYLDFQKAFDKVLHVKLLPKIRDIGLDSNIISWIENWLEEDLKELE